MNNTHELNRLQQKCVVRLVDDDTQFLESLKVLLSMKGWSVRGFSSAEKFIAEERFIEPGCLVLDIRMPNLTGLQLQHHIESTVAHPIPIIFLTGHGDVESAVHTLKHGALDFLQKPVVPAVLLDCIQQACAKSLTSQGERSERDRIEKRFNSLTKREKQIFEMAAQGVSNKGISARLDIAVPTVKMHRANAFDKVGVHSSLEASKAYFVMTDEKDHDQ